jgi:hypothetical protein
LRAVEASGLHLKERLETPIDQDVTIAVTPFESMIQTARRK